MNKVNFKRETYPTRCEICHRSDLFNPISNYCNRCSNYRNLIIDENNTKDTVKNKRYYSNRQFVNKIIWSFSTALIIFTINFVAVYLIALNKIPFDNINWFYFNYKIFILYLISIGYGFLWGHILRKAYFGKNLSA